MQKILLIIFSQESAAKIWHQPFFLQLKTLLVYLSTQSIAQPEHKDHFERFENELWTIIANVTTQPDTQFKYSHAFFFASLDEFLSCFCNETDTKTAFKDLETTFDRHLFNLLKEYVACFLKLLCNNKTIGVHFIKTVSVALSEPLITHILTVNDKCENASDSLSIVKSFADKILKPLFVVVESNPLYTKALKGMSSLLGLEEKQSYLSYILMVLVFTFVQFERFINYTMCAFYQLKLKSNIFRCLTLRYFSKKKLYLYLEEENRQWILSTLYT